MQTRLGDIGSGLLPSASPPAPNRLVDGGAWLARFDRHRIIARWTLPLWFYVSVTGVIVYLLVYQIYGTAVVAIKK